MNKKEIEVRLELWKAIKIWFKNRMLFEEISHNRYYGGLCSGIINNTRRMDKMDEYYPEGTITTGHIEKYFPELVKYKPQIPFKDNEYYWFSPTSQRGAFARRQIINKVIKDLENKLK